MMNQIYEGMNNEGVVLALREFIKLAEESIDAIEEQSHSRILTLRKCDISIDNPSMQYPCLRTGQMISKPIGKTYVEFSMQLEMGEEL